jgi:hypothetical protein
VVALGCLCTPESMPSICLVYGLDMALGGSHPQAPDRGGSPKKRAFLANLRLRARESARKRVFPSSNRQIHFPRQFRSKLNRPHRHHQPPAGCHDLGAQKADGGAVL